MRALWKGSITFGLVVIPVRLYAATSSQDVHLHYLHRPCLAPVRYAKVCTRCGREVPAEELALGHEAEPGAFVPVEEEELGALPRGPEGACEVVQFLREGEIDAIYFARAYFVEPQEGAAPRAYALLRRAMAETGRVALGRLQLRRRETLALIRPFGERALLLETLHDPDEVRSAAALQIAELPEPSPKEKELALALVDALTAPFRPEEHPDRYREALRELIARKAAHRELRPAGEAGRVVDLMEALRASLAERARQRGDGPVPPPDAGEERQRSL